MEEVHVEDSYNNFTISQLEKNVPGFGSPVPTIGYNIEGNSVFTNFVNFYNDEQFFLQLTGLIQFEKFDAQPFVWSALFWCGDLTFTGVNNTKGNHGTDDNEQEGIGYVGHCVRGFLSDITNGGESGAQQSQVMINNSKQKGAFTDTTSVAALYIPHTNVFEGTIHKNTDNHVFRFWESGLSTSKIPFQGWEVHDEGLESSTSSWSAIGHFDIITAVQASELLTMTTLNFTKEEFKNLYGRLHSINNKQNNGNNDEYDESTTTTSATNTRKQSTFSSAATTISPLYWGNYVYIDIFLLSLLVASF